MLVPGLCSQKNQPPPSMWARSPQSSPELEKLIRGRPALLDSWRGPGQSRGRAVAVRQQALTERASAVCPRTHAHAHQ